MTNYLWYWIKSITSIKVTAKVNIMGNGKVILILFVLFCGVVLLPNRNWSVDSLGYLAEIKWGVELFHPHHLFYNTVNYFLVHGLGLEAIIVVPIINGIIYILILIVGCGFFDSEIRRLYCICLAGFSYGLLRYATDSEVYLWPILFSLLGTLVLYKDNESFKSALLGGYLLSLGCCFHQIHIFWFLGMLFYVKRRIPYLLTFGIVIISYLVVVKFYLHQLINFYNVKNFILHDAVTGQVSGGFSLKGILLGFVNLIRSFIQVHGNVLKYASSSWYWMVFLILMIPLLIWSLIRLVKGFNFSFVKDLNGFQKTVIGIIGVQFLFAVFNDGNAEFMVMIPVLIGILIFQISYEIIRWRLFILFLGAWNYSFGLMMNHFELNLEVSPLVRFVNAHPDDLVILKERGVVNNYLFYENGHIPENTESVPSYYQFRGFEMDSLKNKVIDWKHKGSKVYYFREESGNEVINRESIVMKDIDLEGFQKINIGLKSLYSLSGYRLYEVYDHRNGK